MERCRPVRVAALVRLADAVGIIATKA